MVASSSKQQASDLQSAYEAKTGVNLDREASDLIRYQQAYQAAAQVVSTARDLFQTILKIF
jgi:flagellar hook-associated protein 1 FlgK